jgi:hypothetical protein
VTGPAVRVLPGGDDADGPRFRRSFVAVDGTGAVVGRASATASARHPVYSELHMDVDPGLADVARLLAGALGGAMAAAGCATRWTAVADAGDDAAESVLAAVGLVPVVTSRTGRLGLGGLDLDAPELPAAVTVAAEDPDACVPVYEDLYDECHWWTPYVPFARGVPWASFLGEALPGTAFVARDLLGRPVSAASVHRTPGGPLLLAPTAVRHGTRRPDAVAILGALVARSLAGARTAGATEVEWECDDPMAELWAVLRSLGAETERVRRAWLSAEPPPSGS